MMERHKCKLCSRRFSSGRALGGHMRSHLATLPVPPKTIHQLSDHTESASSSSSDEENVQEQEAEEEEEEEKGLGYVLRENPKKSFKLADPEFSFTVDAGCIIVQDRESETESKNPTRRRRSKRTRKMGITQNQVKSLEKKPKLENSKPSSTESQTELEPVSSVSDASPEEDVAICLMMLSRDIWLRNEEESMVDESKFCSEKYKCEICRKNFPTKQALGGHKASHKQKVITRNDFLGDQTGESENAGKFCVGAGSVTVKIHQCPFCYKVFGSGQALGGHKRSHLLSSATTKTTTTTKATEAETNAKNCGKVAESLIDLNFPPMEDEDVSQLEVSAVSDAEFINPISKT